MWHRHKSCISKPDQLTNDIVIDGINGFVPDPGAQIEDGNTGSSSEYEDGSIPPPIKNADEIISPRNATNKKEIPADKSTTKPAAITPTKQVPKTLMPKKNT